MEGKNEKTVVCVDMRKYFINLRMLFFLFFSFATVDGKNKHSNI